MEDLNRDDELTELLREAGMVRWNYFFNSLRPA